MLKLFYSPGACSLVPHILLKETGLPHEVVKVDLRQKQTAQGEDYRRIAPKGSVPALLLANGELLTEGPIIAQYICDQAGRTDLMPAAATMARYRVMEWQNYITSELHKSFSVLFNPEMDAQAKQTYTQVLQRKYALVEATLQQHTYLTGDAFTAADAYLFTVTTWARLVKVDLSHLEALQRFMALVAQRESVVAAQRAESAA